MRWRVLLATGQEAVEVEFQVAAMRDRLMKSIPRFLRGLFRNVLKVALEEALKEDQISQERGWKLLLLLPRMLLHRMHRYAKIPWEELLNRFELFARPVVASGQM